VRRAEEYVIEEEGVERKQQQQQRHHHCAALQRGRGRDPGHGGGRRRSDLEARTGRSVSAGVGGV